MLYVASASPNKKRQLESALGGGLVERVVGRLLAEVVRAEAEGRWDRLKACSNEGCR